MCWPKIKTKAGYVVFWVLFSVLSVFLFYMNYAKHGIAYIILTCVILLAIMHILLIWLFLISNTGWKIIEYVYVALAFFMICYYAFQVDKIYTASKYVYNLSGLYSQYEMIQNSFGVLKESSVCRNFVINKSSPDDIVKVQKEHNWACGELSKIKVPDELSRGRDLDQFEGELKMICDKIKDEHLKNIFSEYIATVEQYNKLIAENMELKSRSNNGLEEFVVFAPFVLSLVLALRITKVTHDLLQVRGKLKV